MDEQTPTKTTLAAASPTRLSLVHGEGDMHSLPAPERRRPVARWAISLCEPLLTTHERVLIDREMIRFIRQNPNWSAAWFAGLLYDTVATLPADDPWRNLSGTIVAPRSGRRLVAEHPGVAAPRFTGARTAHGPFGSVSNTTDLLGEPVGDPAVDVAVAAVRHDMDPVAAALVAFAGHGWRCTRGAIEEVYSWAWKDGSGLERSAKAAQLAALESVAQAVRAVTHRRRIYSGSDDQFTVLCAYSWLARADAAMENREWEAANGQEIVESAAIEDGAWTDLRIPEGD